MKVKKSKTPKKSAQKGRKAVGRRKSDKKSDVCLIEDVIMTEARYCCDDECCCIM